MTEMKLIGYDGGSFDVDAETYPCDETCEKCGSGNVRLRWYPTGANLPPLNTNGIADSRRQPIESDIIRCHCRLCDYEWDTVPLSDRKHE